MDIFDGDSGLLDDSLDDIKSFLAEQFLLAAKQRQFRITGEQESAQDIIAGNQRTGSGPHRRLEITGWQGVPDLLGIFHQQSFLSKDQFQQ